MAIDSGSGDLDVSGKGCQGCTTAAPNNAYDHTASSTAKSAFPFIFSNTYQTCDLKAPTAACTISGRLFADQVSLAGLGPIEVSSSRQRRVTSSHISYGSSSDCSAVTVTDGPPVTAVIAAQCLQ